MTGQTRQGACRASFTVDKKLLEQFDALPPTEYRGVKIAKLMRRELVRHRLQDRVPDPVIEECLAVLD